MKSNRDAGLSACPEAHPVEQLGLERGEEAFDQGVVIGVAG